MKKSLLLSGILLAAFLGIADSWYLAESALSGAALACDVSILSGCNAVAQSPYSRFFGIPLGVYGTFFYSFVFVVASILWISRRRLGFFVLYVLSVAGFLASMVFTLIQGFLIKQFCVYCVVSAVIAMLIFVLARSLFIRYAPPKLAVVG